MTDELEIPASAYDIKDWFPERPKPAVVKEIRAFIKRTGKPHLWRGHTHTKPPQGAPIVYLGEFDLPARQQKFREYWAPCPCCTPRHPKYARAGKIGYFPQEGVIRILGPKCFRTLNPEGHDKAYDDMKVEEARASSIAYLFNHLDKVPKIIEVIKYNRAIASAVDLLRIDLLTGLDECLNTKMWAHLRDGGQLKVNVTENVTTRRADGTEDAREQELSVAFAAPVRGYNLLNPKSQNLNNRLKSALSKLEKIEFIDCNVQFVSQQSDEWLKETISLFSSGLNGAVRVFRELEELRQFVSPMSLASFKGWNNHQGCPIRIYMSLEGFDLLVGRSEHNRRRFSIAPEFFHSLKRLPEISEVAISEVADMSA